MSVFTLEQISEGQYDPRDIQRFNEVDEYALMFVQHGQYGKTFDEKKGFYHFHEAMIWRKQNNAYGKFFSYREIIKILFEIFILDISTDRFPANYFERHAIFYENHDVNKCPICKFYFIIYFFLEYIILFLFSTFCYSCF